MKVNASHTYEFVKENKIHYACLIKIISIQIYYNCTSLLYSYNTCPISTSLHTSSYKTLPHCIKKQLHFINTLAINLKNGKILNLYLVNSKFENLKISKFENLEIYKLTNLEYLKSKNSGKRA